MKKIRGAVVVEVAKSMECNKITVILAGYSYCHSGKVLLEMSEKDSNGNFFTCIERNKKFNGYELLVNQQARLFARGSSTVASQHPSGRHAYRFEFKLPSSLPCLFEGHSGQIRYHMEAKVDRPWKSDHKTRKPFTVNEIIDSNLPQYSTVPFGSEEKQIVGYLCRVAGNLTMQASRDRSGYSPGQHISLSALCVNVSTLEMRSMRATLVQRILYRLDDGHTVDVSFEGERIPSRSQDLWNNRPFQIALDITMGTVPFQHGYGQQRSYQTSGNEFMEGGLAGRIQLSARQFGPTLSTQGYPDMPPPSYAVAVGGLPVCVCETEGASNFGDESCRPIHTFEGQTQSNAPAAGQHSSGTANPLTYSGASCSGILHSGLSGTPS